MWWLLLIAVSDLEAQAHSVYATEQQCIQQIDNSLDRCIAVELSVIELPSVPDVAVTVLPSVAEMGPRE